MKDLLRIASLLDNYEQFRLSDKLFKIAQQHQKPKATISDIYDTLNSNTIEEFTNNLKKFAEIYNHSDLKTAMDQYANAGASYNGNLINRDPVIKELYMRVRNTPRMIPEQELVNEIKMLSNPQGTMTTPNENMSFEQLQKSLKLQPSNLLQEYKPIIDSDTLLTDQQKDFLYKIIDSSSQKTQKA